MTEFQSPSTDRNTDKSQQKQTGLQGQSAEERGHAPSGSVTVSDIGSPYGSKGNRHGYESVDFGESGEELI